MSGREWAVAGIKNNMSNFLSRFLQGAGQHHLVVVRTISLGLLLLLAEVAPAGPAGRAVELAPGLTVILPAPLSIHPVQLNAELESTTLVGHLGDQPGYFLVANKVSRSWRISVLWKKLEGEIRNRADKEGFAVTERGSFTTKEGARVWFRAYEFTARDGVSRPVYYLLKQDDVSYWITVTAVEGVRLDVVLPIVEAVVKRMRIAQMGH